MSPMSLVKNSVDMMNIKQILLVSILSLSVSSCSITDIIPNPFKSSGGINANAQIGKENTQALNSNKEELTLKDITSDKVIVNKADKFASVQCEEITVEERTPFWVWLLVIVGWVIDTPQTILSKLKRDKTK